jgi:hypothetical protein
VCSAGQSNAKRDSPILACGIVAKNVRHTKQLNNENQRRFPLDELPLYRRLQHTGKIAPRHISRLPTPRRRTKADVQGAGNDFDSGNCIDFNLTVD